jgi:cell division ATPase FtsA
MINDTLPEDFVYGIDIGTRSVIGVVGYRDENGGFVVYRMASRFHSSRAMVDGQIHDIAAVSATIKEVTKELEEKIGRELKNVCIAAAGRVLETISVKAEIDLKKEAEEVPRVSGDYITEGDLRELNMLAVQQAYEKIRDNSGNEKFNFYCVSSNIVKYYLNGDLMLSLLGHKIGLIAAQVIATFLPGEVVDGLYSAVNGAGLTAVSLTLEPVAAITAAIPQKFRMLNLALVDVGAGTSDICITKEGSVIAYGMIPIAGDELTMAIVDKYLVDFDTAEAIKMQAQAGKEEIEYNDVMLLPMKTSANEVIALLKPLMDSAAKAVAEEIKRLNGGKSVAAVFIVGGGGKFTEFARKLAEILEIPAERAALRGKEVLGNVSFKQEDIEKDSILVTPIGICENYFEQKNSIIYVQLNGKLVRLYDNGRRNVADVIVAAQYPAEDIFPKRGKDKLVMVDGREAVIHALPGDSAKIFVNGESANVSHGIKQGDEIRIIPSTYGGYEELSEELADRDYHEIEEYEDEDELKDDMAENISAGLKVRDPDAADLKERDQKAAGLKLRDPKASDLVKASEDVHIMVTVNDTKIELSGKKEYRVVDILDYYEIDITTPTGKAFILKKNGEDAEFINELKDGDIVEMHWQ